MTDNIGDIRSYFLAVPLLGPASTAAALAMTLCRRGQIRPEDES